MFDIILGQKNNKIRCIDSPILRERGEWGGGYTLYTKFYKVVFRVFLRKMCAVLMEISNFSMIQTLKRRIFILSSLFHHFSPRSNDNTVKKKNSEVYTKLLQNYASRCLAPMREIREKEDTVKLFDDDVNFFSRA